MKHVLAKIVGAAAVAVVAAADEAAAVAMVAVAAVAATKEPGFSKPLKKPIRKRVALVAALFFRAHWRSLSCRNLGIFRLARVLLIGRSGWNTAAGQQHGQDARQKHPVESAGAANRG